MPLWFSVQFTNDIDHLGGPEKYLEVSSLIFKARHSLIFKARQLTYTLIVSFDALKILSL